MATVPKFMIGQNSEFVTCVACFVSHTGRIIEFSEVSQQRNTKFALVTRPPHAPGNYIGVRPLRRS